MFENVVVFGSFLIRTSVVEESLRHVDEDGGEEEEQHEDECRGEEEAVERFTVIGRGFFLRCHIDADEIPLR